MNIQEKEARELREKWNGSTCDHAQVAKEYGLGMATGDYICLQCGHSGWGPNWNKQQQPAK